MGETGTDWADQSARFIALPKPRDPIERLDALTKFIDGCFGSNPAERQVVYALVGEAVIATRDSMTSGAIGIGRDGHIRGGEDKHYYYDAICQMIHTLRSKYQTE